MRRECPDALLRLLRDFDLGVTQQRRDLLHRLGHRDPIGVRDARPVVEPPARRERGLDQDLEHAGKTPAPARHGPPGSRRRPAVAECETRCCGPGCHCVVPLGIEGALRLCRSKLGPPESSRSVRAHASNVTDVTPTMASGGAAKVTCRTCDDRQCAAVDEDAGSDRRRRPSWSVAVGDAAQPRDRQRRAGEAAASMCCRASAPAFSSRPRWVCCARMASQSAWTVKATRTTA